MGLSYSREIGRGSLNSFILPNGQHQRWEPAAGGSRVVAEPNGWLPSAEWRGSVLVARGFGATPPPDAPYNFRRSCPACPHGNLNTRGRSRTNSTADAVKVSAARVPAAKVQTG